MLPADQAPEAKRQKLDGKAGGQASSKKAKKTTVRFLINEAARTKDVDAALDAFTRAREAGDVALNSVQLHCIILSLVAGSESWEAEVARAAREGQAGPETAEMLRRSQAVLDSLDALGEHHAKDVKKNAEVLCTMRARLRALHGDARGALEIARAGLAAGARCKLRTFAPALLGACAGRDVGMLREVQAALRGACIALAEPEFRHVVRCLSEEGGVEEVEEVLREMAREVDDVDEDTAAVLREAFAARRDGREWVCEQCEVEGSGDTPAGTLRALDLEGEEWDEFREGVKQLAMQRHGGQAPAAFETFVAWLEKHGPFHVLIDGANVALFGQNFKSGGFQFEQIERVYDRVQEEYPELRPVVFLHVGRIKSKLARTREARAFLDKLEANHALYVTPQGSNDDWYWMYAAAVAKQSGMLVSNDLMRDHSFQLLAPRYFWRWRQRHQLRFKVSDKHLELFPPPAFTRCIQRLPDNGVGDEEEEEELGREWLVCYPRS
ncbi:unnamed protein product [Pedinophyceae sp. YPF-701]|nr:unnamed protein product [Pedinophyceae sp. YPF-701]